MKIKKTKYIFKWSIFYDSNREFAITLCYYKKKMDTEFYFMRKSADSHKRIETREEELFTGDTPTFLLTMTVSNERQRNQCIKLKHSFVNSIFHFKPETKSI